MILYKLTDEHDQTFGETQWGEGVTHTAPGTGDLCTSGWIHAYHDPILALFLNPVHAQFKHPHVWEAHGVVGMTDHGLKVGCASLTTVRRINMPTITTERRVRFAVRCALAVCSDAGFRAWAVSWLSGANRRQSAAAAAEALALALAADAEEAAAAAAEAAARAAAARAAWAARAAARAAWAARAAAERAWAARAARAAAARARAARARAAEEAALAARELAARAAAEAAAWAARAAEQSLPLIEFAHWAVSDDQLPE
jgi:hypothetical protein